jgi:hypothetical protein
MTHRRAAEIRGPDCSVDWRWITRHSERIARGLVPCLTWDQVASAARGGFRFQRTAPEPGAHAKGPGPARPCHVVMPSSFLTVTTRSIVFAISGPVTQ